MSKKEELLTIKKMLAKVLFNFAEYVDDKGMTIIVDDKVEVGVDVYTYDENGEKITAPDGEYMIPEMGTVVVEGGKVKEIKPIEQPEPEVEVDVEPEMEKEVEQKMEKDETIEKFKSELQLISDKYDKLITVVEGMFKALEKFSEQPVQKEETKEIEIKPSLVSDKKSKVLKYFEK